MRDISGLSSKIDQSDTLLREVVVDKYHQLETRFDVLNDNLNSQIYHLKQTVNMISANKTILSKVKVVFLVHHIEAWDSLVDIYLAMKSSQEFEPIVASINRRFPGQNEYGFEEVIHLKLKADGIEHLRLGMHDSYEGLDIVKGLKPDLIFRQSQWEADIPPAFHTHELRFARLCYVPYAVAGLIDTSVLGHGRDPATDSVFHRSAWKIFYATYEERKRFNKYAVMQSTNLHITGHPKVRRLIKKGEDHCYWPIQSDGKARRTRIIWSPHHSVGNNWSRFGLFPKVYKDMLEWARTDKSVEIVLSCHPALSGAMSLYWGQGGDKKFQSFIDEWSELDNTSIIGSGDYAGVMAASDVLISDGMSFIIEYQFFNKPVIFLERSDHAALSVAGERLVLGTHRVKNLAEAQQKVKLFARGEVDPLKDVQIENTRWLSGDGQAVSNILNAIKKDLLNVNLTVLKKIMADGGGSFSI